MLAEWQCANGGSMAGTKEGGRWARVRRLPVWFWLILLAAVLARAAAFSLYATHHPDEAFQYLEQAHRLVFDYGLVPWEFRFFIRSWLIPLLLAGPMALGEALQPAGMLYLWLPRLFVVLVNLSAVVAAWFIARKVTGLSGNSFDLLDMTDAPVPGNGSYTAGGYVAKVQPMTLRSSEIFSQMKSAPATE